jgi:uncharacterized membrane protein
VQLIIIAVIGLCVGVPLTLWVSPVLGPLIGWDVAVFVYLIWVWSIIWPLDADDTARLAVREDPNRALRDVVLIIAGLASLVAIGVVLATARQLSGYAQQLQVGVGIVSVLLSWFLVHTVFTARYARLYYSTTNGGIDFNQTRAPRYSDFAYVAFTIGMTFQVSDTALTTTEMRTTALRHALLSYTFGAIIIAATVNLLAGLPR